MNLLRRLTGYRPLAFIPDGILLAKGYDLIAANLECTRLERVGSVPHTWIGGLLRHSRLLERILRFGIRFGCRVEEDVYLLAERNRIWRFNLSSGRVQLDQIVQGKKPLCIARIEGVSGFTD